VCVCACVCACAKPDIMCVCAFICVCVSLCVCTCVALSVFWVLLTMVLWDFRVCSEIWYCECMCVCVCISLCVACPTQSITYVHLLDLLVNRFQTSTLLIVQYNNQNLVPRISFSRIWSSAQFYVVLVVYITEPSRAPGWWKHWI